MSLLGSPCFVNSKCLDEGWMWNWRVRRSLPSVSRAPGLLAPLIQKCRTLARPAAPLIHFDRKNMMPLWRNRGNRKIVLFLAKLGMWGIRGLLGLCRGMIGRDQEAGCGQMLTFHPYVDHWTGRGHPRNFIRFILESGDRFAIPSVGRPGSGSVWNHTPPHGWHGCQGARDDATV